MRNLPNGGGIIFAVYCTQCFPDDVFLCKARLQICKLENYDRERQREEEPPGTFTGRDDVCGDFKINMYKN